jgi:hypothetical protein
MAGLRCTELQSRPLEFLDLTSVTLEETTRPGTDAGAATGQPGPALSPAPDRACQQ